MVDSNTENNEVNNEPGPLFDTIENHTEQVIMKKQSRKRQSKPHLWKQTVSKRLKNSGQEYMTKEARSRQQNRCALHAKSRVVYRVLLKFLLKRGVSFLNPTGNWEHTKDKEIFLHHVLKNKILQPEELRSQQITHLNHLGNRTQPIIF